MRKPAWAGERKASYFSLACSIFATCYRLRNTDKLNICLHHRESLALSTPLTYHVSFLKLFQSTEPNLISGRRQKGGWANGCHSIFCKKPVSLCLSAQERLITTRINIRVRIWVLQWERRKKRKPPRAPVKSFINFLVLTVSKKGVVAAI